MSALFTMPFARFEKESQLAPRVGRKLRPCCGLRRAGELLTMSISPTEMIISLGEMVISHLSMIKCIRSLPAAFRQVPIYRHIALGTVSTVLTRFNNLTDLAPIT